MKNRIMFNFILVILIINIAISIIVISISNVSIASSEILNNTSVFDKNIKKYNWTVKQDSSGTTYGLLAPPGIEKIKNVPVIVWLHGTGHLGLSESTPDDGLPSIINSWDMENFYAYILCPSFTMIEKSRWIDNDVTQKVDSLMEEFLAEHDNIDTKHIVLVGHSGGGPGAFHYAIYLEKYFSKSIAISSPAYNGVSNVKIPMLCFAGYSDTEWARYCMYKSFAPTFGKENCIFIDGSHGSIPAYAFRTDTGYFVAMDGNKHQFGIEGNNRSDLIEWLLDGVEIEREGIKIETSKYIIQEKYIKKIQPKTSVNDFKKYISTNALEIKIFGENEKEMDENEKITTGTKLMLKNDAETKMYTLIITGDINKDGDANFLDLILLNKYRLNKLTPNSIEKSAADVVNDDKIDLKDIVKLNKYRLRKIVEL